MKGNAAVHDRKAQNILFNDGHVSAELYPNCGINNDNIWKFWPSNNPTDEQREVGDKTDVFKYAPAQGVAIPKSKDDACLVTERNDLKE
jgi:prepilin-type processing-associated H-X9-DG protein